MFLSSSLFDCLEVFSETAASAVYFNLSHDLLKCCLVQSTLNKYIIDNLWNIFWGFVFSVCAEEVRNPQNNVEQFFIFLQTLIVFCQSC